MEAAAQCVALVLIEMGLSFSGIVCNLLIVATLRQEASERILDSQSNLGPKCSNVAEWPEEVHNMVEHQINN